MGVSADVPSGDEEITAKGNGASGTNAEQDKESAKQVGSITCVSVFHIISPDIHVHNSYFIT